MLSIKVERFAEHLGGFSLISKRLRSRSTEIEDLYPERGRECTLERERSEELLRLAPLFSSTETASSVKWNVGRRGKGL